MSDIPANIHKLDELLPYSIEVIKKRFGSSTITTWGEAIIVRTKIQVPKIPEWGTLKIPGFNTPK